MYTDMEQWLDIRQKVLVKEESKRSILRDTGMHWKTLEKMLKFSEPPGYRKSSQREKPKLGPFWDRIAEIIVSDKDVHRKQRHTAKRIYERLKDEGYTGGYTQVREAVRELQRISREVFVPLVHNPGEAQADFGQALVNVNGVQRKAHFLVISLPYSDAFFVMAFERECTVTFWEGHVRAFEFFGGVPKRITYDNTSIVVSKIVGERRPTRGFMQMQSHYLFDKHLCNVRRANEKGVVENAVRYIRQNYMVPVPQVRSFAELNTILLTKCTENLDRKLRGKNKTKKELLAEDKAAFRPLPETQFEACQRVSTAASTLSLVRFDCNDYSVPVRYANHPVVAKGYYDKVLLCRYGDVIAEHKRIWHKEDVSYNPIHYLALLERKPGALDYASPLSDWQLPECFEMLRARLEHQLGAKGTREYIAVLRLLEKYKLNRLTRAVEKALHFHTPIRDVVAQYLFEQPALRATTFRLDGHEHLRQVTVAMPDVSAYRCFLSQGGTS